MNQQSPVTTESRGFFKVSAFRLWSTVVLILLSAIALTPWSYNTMVGPTALINYMLVAIMVLGCAVAIIDLFVTRNADVESRDRRA